MRLICPNCDAQYNVADDTFAGGGRDVQCSSCDHTWFQTKRRANVSREVSRVLSTPMPSVRKTKSRGLGTYDSQQSVVKSQAHDTPQGAAQTDGPKHQPIKDGPRHRAVDPEVANILKEEAATRRKQTDYSTQTRQKSRDLKPQDIEETLRRVSEMTVESGGTLAGESPAVAAAVAAASQADPRAIPDITEINTALRARAEATDQGGLIELQTVRRKRRGFRRGFFVVLLLVAIAVGPYIFAEEIVNAMPEWRAQMTTYVAVMDELRRSLNLALDTITGLFT
ncbi:zinc-ribbon domain-containing protein [Yoonia sp.]|uniref:zinc-ribbon domain-containing protein n=1 Tax=Yoonia sp. TaxID=2212373 RepID=UPI0035C80D0D